jgi:hypothetical protein
MNAVDECRGGKHLLEDFSAQSLKGFIANAISDCVFPADETKSCRIQE